ncbi:hypothetical protein QTP88_004197 [Uroleucon formosanum]
MIQNKKKLCFFVKKEPAESFIQNVIENDDTVHEELIMSSKDHNDTFISSLEKSAVYSKKHENVIDTVHEELVIPNKDHHDIFISSPEQSAVVLKKNEEERIKNRNIMRRLIDIVLLLGKTGKPFRGHDESILSNQKGMFREIIDLLARPVETFVALNKMTSVTGQSIFDSINIVLKMINKDWSSVLAVCFDGASSMSGNVGGVQTKCKEQNDKILYVHCYAHCLNLVLIDSICENSSTPNNRLIFNFLGTIQFIYNFIEGSPMRHAILQKVALEAGSHLKSLKSCSITRWACRSEAVSAVKSNYSILIVAIDEIYKNYTIPCMKAKGIGLLHQLQSFEFLLGLHLIEPILKMILKVS